MKIDSREIDDLDPNVAKNVITGREMLAALGYPLGISSTLRNDEQQAYLYASGRTRPGEIVTNSQVTTFHGVGLAFDIFKNIKGHEWDDDDFFNTAAEIFKGMGFSWGYDWVSFKEKCHFQWDAGKTYTGAQVRAGDLPPPMPIYEEVEDMDSYKTFCKHMAQWLKEQEKLPLEDWGDGEPEKEFNEAIKMGITDGKKPMLITPRYQPALMVKRGVEKVLRELGGS